MALTLTIAGVTLAVGIGAALAIAVIAFLVACVASHEVQQAKQQIETLERALASLQPVPANAQDRARKTSASSIPRAH